MKRLTIRLFSAALLLGLVVGCSSSKDVSKLVAKKPDEKMAVPKYVKKMSERQAGQNQNWK